MTVEKNQSKTITGVILDDPLANLPVGSRLSFRPDRFHCDAPVGLNSLHEWEAFGGVVIALHFGSTNDQRLMGSGVLVAPGIAVVARHVVEPELDGIMKGEGFICTGVAQHGLMIWRPDQVKLVDHTDLAIVTLAYAAALPPMFRLASISTRLPKVGERVFFAGMRHDANLSEKNHLHVKMWVSAGVITDRYEWGRDRIMAPGPCVAVDCPALGGMSGGPVFDEHGFLIGILSSSFDGERSGPAFVSLVWPALVPRLTPSWPPGLYKHPVSLLEMERSLCQIDRPAALEASYSEKGDVYQARYCSWENAN